MSNQTVMVTGISGYLGLHVAKALLESGHRVRGTIRNRSKESSVREALPDPAGMLSFAVCDLDKYFSQYITNRLGTYWARASPVCVANLTNARGTRQ